MRVVTASLKAETRLGKSTRRLTAEGARPRVPATERREMEAQFSALQRGTRREAAPPAHSPALQEGPAASN